MGPTFCAFHCAYSIGQDLSVSLSPVVPTRITCTLHTIPPPPPHSPWQQTPSVPYCVEEALFAQLFALMSRESPGGRRHLAMHVLNTRQWGKENCYTIRTTTTSIVCRFKL